MTFKTISAVYVTTWQGSSVSNHKAGDCFEIGTFRNAWMFPIGKMMCNVGVRCQEVPSVHPLYWCTDVHRETPEMTDWFWLSGPIEICGHNATMCLGAGITAAWQRETWVSCKPQPVASWWSSGAGLLASNGQVSRNRIGSFESVKGTQESSQVIGHGRLFFWGTMPRCWGLLKPP